MTGPSSPPAKPSELLEEADSDVLLDELDEESEIDAGLSALGALMGINGAGGRLGC